MSAEFITLNSRLSIKKGVLFEQKLKANTEEGFKSLTTVVLLIILLAFCIHRIVVEHNYLYITQPLLVLIWLTPHIKRVYTSLFIETWKTSIRIDTIQELTSAKLDNGLETQVTLHLKNGRKKFIIFRTAENQVDNFIQAFETKEITSVSLSS